MDISNICADLMPTLKKKKEYLFQMLQITEKQTIAIDNAEDNILENLINEKQKLIDCIDILDKVFLEKMDMIKKHYGVNSLEDINVSVPELKLIKNEVFEIKEKLSEIFLKEKENSIKIKKEYDDIKNKLKEISGSKRAVSAYGGKNTQNSGGVFYDNKK